MVPTKVGNPNACAPDERGLVFTIVIIKQKNRHGENFRLAARLRAQAISEAPISSSAGPSMASPATFLGKSASVPETMRSLGVEARSIR